MVGEHGTTVHEELLDVADVMVRRNELPIHQDREFAFVCQTVRLGYIPKLKR